jgi:hypothetical protein
MQSEPSPTCPTKPSLDYYGYCNPSYETADSCKNQIAIRNSLKTSKKTVTSTRFVFADNVFLPPSFSLKKFLSMPLLKPQIESSLLDPHYIAFRERIISVIKEFADLKDMKKPTIVLAVRLVDEICNKTDFVIEELPLIAVICLSLAAKLNECFVNVPNLTEIWEFLGGRFSYNKIITAQTIVFSILGFTVIRDTPLTVVSEYLSTGIIALKELDQIRPALMATFIRLLEDYCQHLAFMLIHNPRFNAFSLRIVTSTVLLMGRRHCLLSNWVPELSELTGVIEADLSECVALFSEFVPFRGFNLPVNNICNFFRDGSDLDDYKVVISNELFDFEMQQIAAIRKSSFLKSMESENDDSTNENIRAPELRAKSASYLQAHPIGASGKPNKETLLVIRPRNLPG